MLKKQDYITGGINMAEFIKVYRQTLPALRFIGKKFDNFGGWGEMFANGYFEIIENAAGGPDVLYNMPDYGKDGDAFIGMERHKNGEPLEVRIGMLTPPDTKVPEGFVHIDYPEGTALGVCWIYGKESEVHNPIGECAEKIANAGMTIIPDKDGAVWSFERCQCPRFTMPDDNGNVILDYCYFVK